MQLHSPPSAAKSNNEIINAIDHPYLAKSHLQTEAETNTYRNKLLHPVKLTTAAQSSLNPITQLYLLSPFPHPTQKNNTSYAMPVPILTHLYQSRDTFSLEEESM